MSVRWNQVRALVGAQLRLDLRHPKTGELRMSRAILTAVSFGASSAVLALSLHPHAAALDAVLLVALSFGVVLSAFAVAGSYDDLMGRPREHAWALTLPASERTHYVARLANIGVLTLVMSVSTALPIAGLVALEHGAGVALGAGALMLGGMFGASAAVLAALWGLTLVVSYRLLRPALSALRALLIGALVLGYQWVGMEEPAVADLPWWPAQWLLDAWHGAAGGLLPVGLTAAWFAFLFGFVFPDSYFALLRRIADGENAEEAKPRFGPAPTALERLVVRPPAARAAFGLTAAALHGDRLVRGRVWPAAFLGFVFVGFCWWQGGIGDLFAAEAGSLLTDPTVQLHLSALVVLLFCAQAMAQSVQVSDHVEGAWVFEALPLPSGRLLQVGAQQAILLRVLLPLHLALALLLSLSMPPLHAALHVGFWLAAAAITTRIQVLLHRQLPFTRRSDRFSMAERFVPLMLAVPVSVAFLLVQMVAFTTPESAALLVLGLFVLHGALGHVTLPQRLAVELPEPAASLAVRDA